MSQPLTPLANALLRLTPAALGRLGLLALCVALLGGSGCAKFAKKKAEAKPADTGLTQKYERGPVTLRVRLDRKELSIADRLTLTLEAESAEDFEVELPRFGERLEQFGIVDYRTDQPKLVGKGRVLVRRTYTLEPFLSGDYKVPPMKVKFAKKGADPKEEHEFETEELTVKVESLLPEKMAELKLAEIAPPVAMPRPALPWRWAAAGGLALAAVVALVFWLWRRRRRRAGPALPPVPAHEIAYRELERLVAEDLVAKGEIKLFYLRLSTILRHYIENRFGLHAPERTTEEFLAELGMTAALAPAHKILLKAFLTHSDLVKFAEHHPIDSDIQKTFDSCLAFIGETKTDTPPVAPGAGEAGTAAG